jgi:hypothetical protein
MVIPLGARRGYLQATAISRFAYYIIEVTKFKPRMRVLQFDGLIGYLIFLFERHCIFSSGFLSWGSPKVILVG